MCEGQQKSAPYNNKAQLFLIYKFKIDKFIILEKNKKARVKSKKYKNYYRVNLSKYYKHVTGILNIYYKNTSSIEKFTPVTYNIREE